MEDSKMKLPVLSLRSSSSTVLAADIKQQKTGAASNQMKIHKQDMEIVLLQFVQFFEFACVILLYLPLSQESSSLSTSLICIYCLSRVLKCVCYAFIRKDLPLALSSLILLDYLLLLVKLRAERSTFKDIELQDKAQRETHKQQLQLQSFKKAATKFINVLEASRALSSATTRISKQSGMTTPLPQFLQQKMFKKNILRHTNNDDECIAVNLTAAAATLKTITYSTKENLNVQTEVSEGIILVNNLGFQLRPIVVLSPPQSQLTAVKCKDLIVEATNPTTNIHHEEQHSTYIHQQPSKDASQMPSSQSVERVKDVSVDKDTEEYFWQKKWIVAAVRVFDGLVCTAPCLYIASSLLVNVEVSAIERQPEFIVGIIGLSIVLGVSFATLANFQLVPARHHKDALRMSITTFILNVFTLASATICGVILFALTRRTRDGVTAMVMDIVIFLIILVVTVVELFKLFKKEVTKDQRFGGFILVIGVILAALLQVFVLFLHGILSLNVWLLEILADEFKEFVLKGNAVVQRMNKQCKLNEKNVGQVVAASAITRDKRTISEEQVIDLMKRTPWIALARMLKEEQLVDLEQLRQVQERGGLLMKFICMSFGLFTVRCACMFVIVLIGEDLLSKENTLSEDEVLLLKVIGGLAGFAIVSLAVQVSGQSAVIRYVNALIKSHYCELTLLFDDLTAVAIECEACVFDAQSFHQEIADEEGYLLKKLEQCRSEETRLRNSQKSISLQVRNFSSHKVEVDQQKFLAEEWRNVKLQCVSLEEDTKDLAMKLKASELQVNMMKQQLEYLTTELDRIETCIR